MQALTQAGGLRAVILAAVLSLGVVGVGAGVSSCKAQLTPEAEAAANDASAAATAAMTDSERAEKAAEAALGAALDAAAANDMVEFGAQMTVYDTNVAAMGDAKIRHDAASDTVNAIYAESHGGVGAVLPGVVGAIFPPAAPYANMLGLLLPFAFKRPRKHLVEGLKAGAKGQIGELLSRVVRAAGLRHSSTDPRVLMESARKMAAAAGDTAEVARIDALLTKMAPATPES